MTRYKPGRILSGYKTAQELYDETIERLHRLFSMGFNVIFKWQFSKAKIVIRIDENNIYDKDYISAN